MNLQNLKKVFFLFSINFNFKGMKKENFDFKGMEKENFKIIEREFKDFQGKKKSNIFMIDPKFKFDDILEKRPALFEKYSDKEEVLLYIQLTSLIFFFSTIANFGFHNFGIKSLNCDNIPFKDIYEFLKNKKKFNFDKCFERLNVLTNEDKEEIFYSTVENSIMNNRFIVSNKGDSLDLNYIYRKCQSLYFNSTFLLFFMDKFEISNFIEKKEEFTIKYLYDLINFEKNHLSLEEIQNNLNIKLNNLFNKQTHEQIFINTLSVIQLNIRDLLNEKVDFNIDNIQNKFKENTQDYKIFLKNNIPLIKDGFKKHINELQKKEILTIEEQKDLKIFEEEENLFQNFFKEDISKNENLYNKIQNNIENINCRNKDIFSEEEKENILEYIFSNLFFNDYKLFKILEILDYSIEDEKLHSKRDKETRYFFRPYKAPKNLQESSDKKAVKNIISSLKNPIEYLINHHEIMKYEKLSEIGKDKNNVLFDRLLHIENFIKDTYHKKILDSKKILKEIDIDINQYIQLNKDFIKNFNKNKKIYVEYRKKELAQNKDNHYKFNGKNIYEGF